MELQGYGVQSKPSSSYHSRTSESAVVCSEQGTLSIAVSPGAVQNVEGNIFCPE